MIASVTTTLSSMPSNKSIELMDYTCSHVHGDMPLSFASL